MTKISTDQLFEAKAVLRNIIKLNGIDINASAILENKEFTIPENTALRLQINVLISDLHYLKSLLKEDQLLRHGQI